MARWFLVGAVIATVAIRLALTEQAGPIRCERRAAPPVRTRPWAELARHACDREEFGLAIFRAERALRLDRGDPQAARILRTAREEYDAERAELREKFNEEWRAIMERLEHGGCDLGGDGPLNYPEEWDEVSERDSANRSR